MQVRECNKLFKDHIRRSLKNYLRTYTLTIARFFNIQQNNTVSPASSTTQEAPATKAVSSSSESGMRAVWQHNGCTAGCTMRPPTQQVGRQQFLVFKVKTVVEFQTKLMNSSPFQQKFSKWGILLSPISIFLKFTGWIKLNYYMEYQCNSVLNESNPTSEVQGSDKLTKLKQFLKQEFSKEGILFRSVSIVLILTRQMKLFFDSEDLCNFVVNELIPTCEIQENGKRTLQKLTRLF